MGERQFETYVKSTIITLNTYLQGLPSHHQCRGYIQIYTCVQDSETDNCGTEVEIITLMEVKTQEHALKFFSAWLVIISIQRNEQNTRFKH